MLRKFRGKSLKLDKKNGGGGGDALETPVAPYCHSCGQRTPSHSTFGSSSSSSSFSSASNGDRSSWNSSYRRRSGGGSRCDGLASSSSSQASGSRAGDSVVSIPAPPSRRGTYSSSIYSHDGSAHDDDDDDDAVDPFPVIVEECYEYEFGLPPRTLSNYSAKLKPRSRYAKLNELPAASPRSLLFPEDLYDLDAGIERGESKEASKRKRGRWHKGSISLRKLSIGKKS